MPRFLVEAYVGRTNCSDLAEIVCRLERAAEQLTARGVPVHYVRSTLVPEDETCFHVIEGPSLEEVEEVGRRAELAINRVTKALEPIPNDGGLR